MAKEESPRVAWTKHDRVLEANRHTISHVIVNPNNATNFWGKVCTPKKITSYLHIKYDLPNVLVTYGNHRTANANTLRYSLFTFSFGRIFFRLSFQMVAHLTHLTAWPMGESTRWWAGRSHGATVCFLVLWSHNWLVVFSPPIWKICSSNGKSSPIFGVKIKNIWNHHLDNLGNNTFPVALLDIDDSSAFMPF